MIALAVSLSVYACVCCSKFLSSSSRCLNCRRCHSRVIFQNSFHALWIDCCACSLSHDIVRMPPHNALPVPSACRQTTNFAKYFFVCELFIYLFVDSIWMWGPRPRHGSCRSVGHKIIRNKYSAQVYYNSYTFSQRTKLNYDFCLCFFANLFFSLLFLLLIYWNQHLVVSRRWHV